jgi:nicotinamidase-related amidase
MISSFARPALVVIDVQNAIDDPMWGPRNNPGAEDVIAGLLAWWRSRKLPIIHVRHDSTEPDSAYRPGQSGNDFKAEARPLPGETVVAKQTNSAFSGTDLADQLIATGCDVVVFAGVITNNSLEATVRMSGNLGFESLVVADGCWTVDTVDLRGRRWPAEDVHALSLANMDGEYAKVVSAREIETAITPASS